MGIHRNANLGCKLRTKSGFRFGVYLSCQGFFGPVYFYRGAAIDSFSKFCHDCNFKFGWLKMLGLLIESRRFMAANLVWHGCAASIRLVINERLAFVSQTEQNDSLYVELLLDSI